MITLLLISFACAVFLGATLAILRAEDKRDERLYAALQAPARGRHHRGGPAWTPAAACTA